LAWALRLRKRKAANLKSCHISVTVMPPTGHQTVAPLSSADPSAARQIRITTG
jgi:hypothetical protein